MLLATIGAGTIVLTVLIRGKASNCVEGGGMRLRVGRVVYDVPAGADAYPHAGPRTPGIRYDGSGSGRGQFCQDPAVPVIDTPRFGFWLPGDARSDRGQAAQSIGRPDYLARAFRPDFPAFRRSDVVRVTPAAIAVDRQERRARLVLEIALSSGTVRRVPVHCQWATGAGANGEGLLSTCRMELPLAGGNVLSVVASPHDNDLDFLGASVLRALGAADDFNRGGRTS